MKYLFATSLLLLLYLSTYSQENEIRIGVEGGGNLVKLRGSQFFDKSRVSGIGGLHIQYRFSKLFAIRTGLFFEDKGSLDKFDFIDFNGNPFGSVEIITRLEYLTVPILARITFGNKIKYFANIGPYIGFLQNAKFITESQASTISDSEEGVKDNFQNIDFGASGGMGAEYPLIDKLMISIEVRHNYGLSNIDDSEFSDVEINTNSTNFLLGVSYLLGK